MATKKTKEEEEKQAALLAETRSEADGYIADMTERMASVDDDDKKARMARKHNALVAKRSYLDAQIARGDVKGAQQTLSSIRAVKLQADADSY